MKSGPNCVRCGISRYITVYTILPLLKQLYRQHSGPSFDPCGTPHLTLFIADPTLPTSKNEVGLLDNNKAGSVPFL